MNITAFDNYLRDPHKWRAKALAATYRDVEATGAIFPNIGEIPPEMILPGQLSFFRLTLPDDILPTYIHNDSAMAKTTGILYLNLPSQCEGGTAFWKHKESGLTSAPTPADLEVLGADYVQKLVEDGLQEDRWEQTGLVDMRFNRLLVFDSALWHSPWPRKGWGSDISNGRLIQVFFLP